MINFFCSNESKYRKLPTWLVVIFVSIADCLHLFAFVLYDYTMNHSPQTIVWHRTGQNLMPRVGLTVRESVERIRGKRRTLTASNRRHSNHITLVRQRSHLPFLHPSHVPRHSHLSLQKGTKQSYKSNTFNHGNN